MTDYNIVEENGKLIFIRHKEPTFKAKIIKGETEEDLSVNFSLAGDSFHLEVIPESTNGKPIAHLRSKIKNAKSVMVKLFQEENKWWMLKYAVEK